MMMRNMSVAVIALSPEFLKVVLRALRCPRASFRGQGMACEWKPVAPKHRPMLRRDQRAGPRRERGLAEKRRRSVPLATVGKFLRRRPVSEEPKNARAKFA